MKYSKEQLEAMSDFEINCVVTSVVNNEDYSQWAISADESSFYQCGIDGDQFHAVDIYDYCKDVIDIMPLVFEAGISLISSGGGWYTAHSEDLDVATLKCSHECYCSNPLRAAAIVYILVMQDT